MQQVLQYALIGLGIGALYALASQGLVLIYRGSGVLNFAHGAIGMVGAYFEYELQYHHGWPFVPALIIGILVSALLGAITHLFVMRPLRRASPLARVVATLGVLIVLESIGYLR
jgi:branched-subunit amino acid ABC-type transport system permease component